MIARMVLVAAALAAPRPSGPLDPANCTTSGCHADVKHFDVVHGPVSVNACDACHRLVDEAKHVYDLARPDVDLCTFCHDMGLERAAVVHAPLLTGGCVACHDPHGGPDRNLLRGLTDDACGSCHDNVLGDMPHVHGPVAAGACSACHVAHASQHPGLLSAPPTEMCVSCHASTSHQLDALRFVHEPAAGDCLACHGAHSARHPMLLLDGPEKLCMSCHEPIRQTVETAATPHSAVMTDQACLNCHEPHASDFAGVLRANEKTLCFECHDREIEMPDGKDLDNVKAVIESGTSLHGPVADDDCSACHQVHGGDFFRLLVKAYPPEFYAPFEEERYALCFECHDPQLVRDERTTALTDFRNGDLNLHFLHVNRDRKGRTCRACHETHAAMHENFVRESVPFGPGGWELPIRFEPTDNGGRCAPGCHVPYEYNRVEPVQYRRPASPALWPTGGSP